MKVKDLIEAKRALCKLVSQDVPVYWALRIAMLVDAVDPLFTDVDSVIMHKCGKYVWIIIGK